MNLSITHQIIEQYKTHFDHVSQNEIYKWKAIKCFQDHWDIQADNFTEMLSLSLKKTANLLASQNYFPKRMLIYMSEASTEPVRSLFLELFDEETNLIDRLAAFKKGAQEIVEIHFPEKINHYQDERAMMVYLTMMFPDRYYFYKFSMFKEIATTIGYPYIPSKGKLSNIPQYISLCNLLKEEVLKDNELLHKHNSRLTEQEYMDASYNILTQDIVYSLKSLSPISSIEDAKLDVNLVDDILLMPRQVPVDLKGVFLNYEQIAKEKTRVGKLGEILIFHYEAAKLLARGSRMKPKHTSSEDGDGLGYDILSYDDNDHPVYIEVKTTTGKYDKPFFITRNELECSIRHSSSYILYRLYNFNPKTQYADLIQYRGNLLDLCTNPILFEV